PRSEFCVIKSPLTPVAEVYDHEPAQPGGPFPRLFYWGRVERQKGCDLLVEALPEIAARYPNVRLVIGGAETTEHGQPEPYAAVARRRLAELGLADKVEFRGFMTVEQIRRQVAGSDLCVFPSRYETACYAALEAITYGGCVVATTVGGLPEYVAHGVSGWLVEPESPPAIAEAVVRLAGDEQLRRQLRRTARPDVIARCDPLVAARESAAVYEKAIAAFAKRACAPNRAYRQIIAGLLAGMRSSGDPHFHELLCAKYSEGAAAGYQQGYEQGLQEGLCATRNAGTFSLLRRLARAVRGIISAGHKAQAR
ncbi:MAG TPA: glycosyltransferase family 4 protein, partial [Candidatus Obscuribacterales bacterium]